MAAAPASTRCRFAPRHRSSGTSAPASSRSRSPGSTRRAVVPAGSRPLDASLRAGRHPEHCRIDHRPLRRPGGRTACSRTQARHARSSSSHAAPGRRSARRSWRRARFGARRRASVRYPRSASAVCMRARSCAVVGNDTPQAFAPGEIAPSAGHAFYDYDAKYSDPDGAKLITRAELPDRTRAAGNCRESGRSAPARPIVRRAREETRRARGRLSAS